MKDEGEYEDHDEEQEEEGATKEEEDFDPAEFEPDIGINFTATVEKGDGQIMVYHCVAGDKVYVKTITHSKDTELSAYKGPKYEELDLKIQDSVAEYLEERGINEYLAIFICMYADYKEQKEYVKWLKQYQKFLDA